MNYSLLAVLLSTFVTFCSFYAPQPLLPYLAEHYSVSPPEAGLLITIPFAILCVAPLAYGALLQWVSARNMLLLGTIALGVSQYWFATAGSFTEMLACRIFQSLLYPALFTAAVTYCSQAGHRDQIAARISLYIATTILGGYLGRLASGFLASWFHWTVIFKLMALALGICAAMLCFAKVVKPALEKSNKHSLGKILRQPTFVAGYCLIFTTFFAFSATLNALPFRLVSLDPQITAATISLVYTGYLPGIFIATNAARLATLAGGRVRAMRFALLIFVMGLALLYYPGVHWLMAMCFLTAGGFFLIHATLNGYLTSLEPQQAGMINGVYISIYYAAGASGSLLPLWIYNHFGWQVFLFTITAVAALGFVSLNRLPSVRARAA